ncbi:MAG: hypothetical protein DRJ01_08025 [Bacteroidetes bacterium]|nr:MAG: hypothetical protein DRJ01_08025 [Bacteroidota bacterium]
MKLLMIYANKFGYKPQIKTLENFEEKTKEMQFDNTIVAFIHAEKEDEENIKAVETKLVKNLKWMAKKNNTNKVILHSFAHLSDSKADPELTKSLFDFAEQKLVNAGYETEQTPFGYFLDLHVDAPGYSLARVFKQF